MRRTILFITVLSLAGIMALSAACGSGSDTATNAGSNKPSDTGTSTSTVATGKSFATGPAGNNLTATLSSDSGTLKKGKQEFTLTFSDASGKPVDVGSVALNYRMPAMGSMAEMNNGSTFKTTSTPGVYAGSVDIEMAGEWQAQITYEGSAGKGSFSLSVVAK